VDGGHQWADICRRNEASRRMKQIHPAENGLECDATRGLPVVIGGTRLELGESDPDVSAQTHSLGQCLRKRPSRQEDAQLQLLRRGESFDDLAGVTAPTTPRKDSNPRISPDDHELT